MCLDITDPTPPDVLMINSVCKPSFRISDSVIRYQCHFIRYWSSCLYLCQVLFTIKETDGTRAVCVRVLVYVPPVCDVRDREQGRVGRRARGGLLRVGTDVPTVELRLHEHLFHVTWDLKFKIILLLFVNKIKFEVTWFFCLVSQI